MHDVDQHDAPWARFRLNEREMIAMGKDEPFGDTNGTLRGTLPGKSVLVQQGVTFSATFMGSVCASTMGEQSLCGTSALLLPEGGFSTLQEPAISVQGCSSISELPVASGAESSEFARESCEVDGSLVATVKISETQREALGILRMAAMDDACKVIGQLAQMNCVHLIAAKV